jgi:hypothetical protein
MKLHIYTQDQENYGAHDWDGKGQCPQYWKFKGGQDYFVPMGNSINSETATAIVMAVRGDIEESNDYYISQIIGWDVVADDFMTDFEKSQLEWEGKIMHPAKIINLEVA